MNSSITMRNNTSMFFRTEFIPVICIFGTTSSCQCDHLRLSFFRRSLWYTGHSPIYAPSITYGGVRIEIDKIEKLAMHKIDTSLSLSLQAAHDKFRENPNPVCHAVWAKTTAPAMLLWQHIAYP
ncbi:unnamed protein product [Amoebophrya sp. A120]|nr:unnamed protein product [Amoebophrya sp. A120]|eukprot:GSA120T00019819001.1